MHYTIGSISTSRESKFTLRNFAKSFFAKEIKQKRKKVRQLVRVAASVRKSNGGLFSSSSVHTTTLVTKKLDSQSVELE